MTLMVILKLPHLLEYGEGVLLSQKTLMPFFLGLIGLMVNLK
jgi:hypothetical protein